MRCTTCGTENAPDSRFCGGCGARQPASGEQRLAPTAKILDDAPFPQSSGPTNVRPPTGPVSYAPPSIPPPASTGPHQPVNRGPASIPPTSNPPKTNPPKSNPPTGQQRHVSGAQKPVSPVSSPPVSSPPRPAPAQLSNPSGSFSVPPQRSLALIVIVLVLDLGLAAAGGVLLMKGLADKKPAKTEPAPAEKKSAIEAVPPAPSPPAAAAAAPAPAVEPVASTVVPPAPAAAAREAPKDPTKREKAKAFVEDKPKPKGDAPKTDAPKTDAPKTKPEQPARVDSVPTEPQDPRSMSASTEQEIDAAAAKSKPAFARCATEAGSVQGTIKIALQVRNDGHVINAAAVDNTTGDGELARCLVSEVSSWRVSAHHGAAINLLRTFNYP